MFSYNSCLYAITRRRTRPPATLKIWSAEASTLSSQRVWLRTSLLQEEPKPTIQGKQNIH